MRPLVKGIDLVIANEEDLQSCLGVRVAGTDVTGGRLDLDSYREAAQLVANEFGVRMVAITLRESHSASDNGWSAVLWDQTWRVSIRASGSTCGLSIGLAGETVLPLADLRPPHRAPDRGRASVRRRGQRAETNNSRRFQPCDR